MRWGSTVTAIRDVDVRPDSFNPLSRYAATACELWSSWASFYQVVAEIRPVPKIRKSLSNNARLWFPNLPETDSVLLHTVEDAVGIADLTITLTFINRLFGV